jgi:SAM-dependent methyltransferase
MGLWHDFLAHQGRMIHKWSHYFPAYERHFSRFCNTPVTMLEIGCGHGGSAQMWKRYLGPYALIVGVDIDEYAKSYEDDQIAIRIGNQSDGTFLAALVEEFGAFDIVLDDGSHHAKDVHASFRGLYPTMPRGGVYMVEDLITSYWPTKGGGYRAPNSFIETCKGLIDELHAYHTGEALLPTQFTNSTLSMHFYDGIVVFERGTHRPGVSLHTGTIARPKT